MTAQIDPHELLETALTHETVFGLNLFLLPLEENNGILTAMKHLSAPLFLKKKRFSTDRNT